MPQFNKYSVVWNEYANNLSTSFSELLKHKELIDVTLVADGCLFDAHRLVLSALSPYFRRMFTQIPANRQAFVFMKDVSKQTLHNLMAYIYLGEINVSDANFKDFLNTAKALEIKGLTQKHELQEIFAQPLEQPTLATIIPTYNNSQYQATQTIRIQNLETKTNTTHSNQSNNFYQAAAHGSQQQNNFNKLDGGTSALNENGGYTMDTHFDVINDLDMAKEDASMDLDHGASCAETWNVDQENSKSKHFIKPNVFMQCKRKNTKRIYNGYDVAADIRANEMGRENLYYDNQKFYLHTNGLAVKRWCCTKKVSHKCRAVINTIQINDDTMMKIIAVEHTHEP